MLGIHHAGITVSSLERSLDFYVHVLGLRVEVEPTPHRHGLDLDRMLEVPGASMRVALVRAGAGLIELHEFAAPPSTIAAPVPPNTLGAQHVALEVADIDATVARLVAAGWPPTTPVNRIETGPFAGLTTVFVRDPDGVRVEFIQVDERP